VTRTDRFMYRSRYFTDSGIIGSKEFVSRKFQRFKTLLQVTNDRIQKPGKKLHILPVPFRFSEDSMARPQSTVMDTLNLFTDGSADALSNVGYGAYLAVCEYELPISFLKRRVNVRRFEQTSSTRLELQTLLWALNDVQAFPGRVVVFTDSQNIFGLPARRERLKKMNYWSKKGERLKNYELYREFYRKTDQLDCHFVKVPGHQVSNRKDRMQKLFTLVDRAARNALRSSYR